MYSIPYSVLVRIQTQNLQDFNDRSMRTITLFVFEWRNIKDIGVILQHKIFLTCYNSTFEALLAHFNINFDIYWY